jgi:peptidoglycan DL-endopeptidase CwlO
VGAHRSSPAVSAGRILAVSAAIGTTFSVVQSVPSQEVSELVQEPPAEVAPAAFPAVISVAPDPVVVPAATSYTVVSGDSLARIALSVGQPLSDLVGRNRDRVSDPDKIYPGLVLSLTGEVKPAPAKAPAKAVAAKQVPAEAKTESVPAAAPVVQARGVSAVPSIAKTFTGVPYRWGGKDRASGLDCSGFVYNVFKQAGLTSTYRTSRQLESWATPVSRAEARAGDLVFGPGHVGIYLGNGMMIDSAKHGTTIAVRKVYSTMNSYGRVPA